MRSKKKDKKAKEESNEAILASVGKEMAQPRVAKSAQIQNNKQMHAIGEKIL